MKNLRKKWIIFSLFSLCSFLVSPLEPADLEGRQWVMTPDSAPGLRIYLRLEDKGRSVLIYTDSEMENEGKIVVEEWYLIPYNRKDLPQRLVLQDYMGEFTTFSLNQESSEMSSGIVIDGLSGTFFEVEASEYNRVFDRFSKE